MAKRTPNTETKRGRRTTFNEKDAAEIVARLSKGEPMTHICAEDWLPTDRTVRNWITANEAFASDIACARESGHDAIAHRTRLTARGKTEEEGGDSSGDVQRDKLIIDTDLKLLAKWDPKRYGDKLAHVGGSDGDAPIQTAVTLRFVKPA